MRAEGLERQERTGNYRNYILDYEFNAFFWLEGILSIPVFEDTSNWKVHETFSSDP